MTQEHWNNKDTKLIKTKWANWQKQDSINAFPDRTYKSIERKANSLNLKKSNQWKENYYSSLKTTEVDNLKKMTEKEKKKLMDKMVRESVRKVVSELPEKKRFEPISNKKTNRKLKKESWLLQLSDFHDGLKVKAVEVGGLSEYGPEIGAERLHRLGKSLVRILDYAVLPPKELVIAFQGDNVDNAIMRGQQYGQIAYGIFRQVTQSSELFTDFIIEMSKFFPRIRCYGVPGNHGRMTKSPTDSIPEDNFDNMVYYILKERLKGLKGITFDYEPEVQHLITRVEGYLFWIQHGDTTRSWAGIPFYGAKREKSNINAILGEFGTYVPYVLTAHHHTPAEFEGVIMNGSFVGGDTYSIGRLRRMSPPSQNLLGVSSGHGIVWKRPIGLIDKPKKSQVKIYK